VWDRPRGRWMHPKGANSMAMVGLGFKMVLVGTMWAILSSYALCYGLENSPVTL